MRQTRGSFRQAPPARKQGKREITRRLRQLAAADDRRLRQMEREPLRAYEVFTLGATQDPGGRALPAVKPGVMTV